MKFWIFLSATTEITKIHEISTIFRQNFGPTSSDTTTIHLCSCLPYLYITTYLHAILCNVSVEP